MNRITSSYINTALGLVFISLLLLASHLLNTFADRPESLPPEAIYCPHLCQ